MILDTEALSNRERYQLLTSLVVPRPIAWVSTRSAAGVRNLAPFSYFAALSATPFLVSISIGSRRGEPKDTLRNIRETGVFCINVVTEPQLAPMNVSSGKYVAEVDEFERACIVAAQSESVDAPYVAGCPAVLECRVFKAVELEGSVNTLVIGEILRVRFADEVALIPDTVVIDSVALGPSRGCGGTCTRRSGRPRRWHDRQSKRSLATSSGVPPLSADTPDSSGARNPRYRSLSHQNAGYHSPEARLDSAS